MGQKRLAKKVDRFERKADKFKDKASSKASKLSTQASTKAHELSDKAAVKMGKKPEKKKGKKGFLGLLVAGLAGAGVLLKKKREQELDEALWEEPRAL